MKKAMLYEKFSGQRVHCRLCAWQCVIAEGNTGFCQVRINRGGTWIEVITLVTPGSTTIRGNCGT